MRLLNIHSRIFAIVYSVINSFFFRGASSGLLKGNSGFSKEESSEKMGKGPNGLQPGISLLGGTEIFHGWALLRARGRLTGKGK